MLVADNISKKFPGVTALDCVSLELQGGKVTALIGENGAGKSTLMKILSGVYTDYEGNIIHNGNIVRFKNTRDAQAKGIAIIHQELNLVPGLTVTENIFLGCETLSPLGLLDKKQMRSRTLQLLGRLKLDVSPDAQVESLKVGQQQMVEIAKALLHNAEVIIMDEPTSAIGDKEVKVLFGIIEDLKKEGRIIVYISHKLDELFTIADTYVVLRDGRFIESGNMKDVSHDVLIQKMVGREITTGRQKTNVEKSGELLSIEGLTLFKNNRQTAKLLKNISFKLHKGEVLGIFGLMGAGRTELLETIFGLHAGRATGKILINKKECSITSPAAAVKAGIALVPEDRKKDGLVLSLDVKENISITTLHQLLTAGMVNGNKASSLAEEYINNLRIKTSSQKQQVKTLSGGNQQKIVLAKWMATNPYVLMLDEPTRGIDIHAKTEIYKLISQLASGQMGILVVSSEMPELLAIADRILVMSDGCITADISIQNATEDKLLTAAIPKTN
ncbi:MAG TPA: sugar ABC transporter ATP-binding protein [Chitinophagaceae bacterium]|nr:sugar ABC transporter ATP-binding protein [Chitinophagaceae bacterium]